MNLVLSMVACFCAVQTGALVVCVGMMVAEAGPAGVFEGVGVWAIGQIPVLPIALFSMPLGVLLRWILGMPFQKPKPVALITGFGIGLVGAILLTLDDNRPETIAVALSLGALAGLVGGWTWWLIERPYLEAAR